MISCDFSDSIAASTALLSVDGKWLASALGCKLQIRNSSTLEIDHTFTCIDKPDKIEFSPDSLYIFCAFLTRSAIQCFSMSDVEWKCRINEGVSGFINAHWMPDSRGIATISDFGIQITIWSLVDSTSYVISNPKHGLGILSANSATQQQLLAFSDCSRFFTVVHRLELHDYIGVYATNPYKELSKFKSKSNDVTAIYWTPNGTHIVTVDSALTYKAVIYTVSGECVASFEAFQHALGIRSIGFFRPSPSVLLQPLLTADAVSSAQLMTIGSYDSKVRILSIRSWQAAFVFPLVHPRDMDTGLCEPLTGPYPPVLVLEIPIDSNGELIGDLSAVLGINQGVASSTVFDATRRTGVIFSPTCLRGFISKKATAIKALPFITPDPRNAKFLPPQQGVSWHARSHCGTLLAAREASSPRCLWIWSVLDAKLQTIIIQMDPVTNAQWRPTPTPTNGSSSSSSAANRQLENGGNLQLDNYTNSEIDNTTNNTTNTSKPLLAYCTGSSKVFFWSPSSVEGKSEGEVECCDLQAPNTSSSSFNTSFMSTTTTSSTIRSSVFSAQKMMGVNSLTWSKDGKKLLLKGKESYTLCEISIDEDGTEGY